MDNGNVSRVAQWDYLLKILADPSVSEVESNGINSFFIVKDGLNKELTVSFPDVESYVNGVKDGLVPLCTSPRDFEERGFLYEGRLEYEYNGYTVIARCHIGLPPTTRSPQITIAKKSASLRTLDKIAEQGTMSSEMLEFIKFSVDAGMTMVISGGTGSGKDLHKDTVIPTPHGLSTVGKLNVGDVIFDESGNNTKILRKYQPLDKRHYRLTFSNGETVDAGMGHLWKISLLNHKIELLSDYLLSDEQRANILAGLKSKDKFVSLAFLHDLIGGSFERLVDHIVGFMITGKYVFVKNEVLSHLLRVDEKYRFGRDVFRTSLVTTESLLSYIGNGSSDVVAIESSFGAVDYAVKDDFYLHDPFLGASSVAFGKGDSTLTNDYKFASVLDRVTVVSGIASSGSVFNVNDGSVAVKVKPSLVSDFMQVLSSLAWKPSVLDGVVTFYPDVQIFRNNDRNYHLLANYLKNGFKPGASNYVVLDSVTLLDNSVNEDYYCFEVDAPSHTFLWGESFLVTHNTTLLESITKLFPADTRIAVAEDVSELVLVQKNVSYWEAVPFVPGNDPNAVADLKWIVKQFQRNRNHKIIIGETRGSEFSEFLIAANSGKNGSLTTIHADDPTSCLRKMTNFALQGFGNSNIRSINQDLGTAVNLIIQLNKFPDKGIHRVTHIQEIIPTISNDEDASITSHTLYGYDYNTDTFDKQNNVSSNFRKLCAQRGVDPSAFTKTPLIRGIPGHHAISSGSDIHGDNQKPKSRVIGTADSSDSDVGSTTRRINRIPRFNGFRGDA